MSSQERYITKPIALKNGLRALLMSTHGKAEGGEDTGISSGCLAVGAGSFSEPAEVHGAGHLCEHCLFCGTRSYPGIAPLEQFTTQNDGMANGQTLYEATTINFSIKSDLLETALSHVSSMVSEPLFRKSDIDREILMIESEVTLKRRNSDVIHDHYLMYMAKEGAPLSNFSWGSLYSLSTLPKLNGVSVYKAVRQFFHQHYSASVMTLVIMSDKSLDVLEKLVRRYFEGLVVTEGAGAHAVSKNFKQQENPVDANKYISFLKITALEYSHTLYITWVYTAEALVNPEIFKLFSFCLCHGGKGSLLGILICKGLGFDVDVSVNSPQTSSKIMGSFEIRVSLTERGVDDLWRVVELIFQVLRLIREMPIKDIEKLFKLKSNEGIDDFEEEDFDRSETLSLLMQIEDQVKRKKESTITITDVRKGLDILSPSLMNVCLISPTVKSTHDDRWLRTKHRFEDLSSTSVSDLNDVAINPAMMPPSPSPYSGIQSRRVPLNSTQSKARMLVYENKGSETRFPAKLYHHWERGYDSTEAQVNICVHVPEICSSLKTFVLAELYVKSLQQLLYEDLYYSVTSVIPTKVELDYQGIVCRFIGESGPLLTHIKKVVHTISTSVVDKMVIDMGKGLLQDQYKESLIDASTLCDARLEGLIAEKRWRGEDKLDCLHQITTTEVKDFLSLLQRTGSLIIMVMGNIRERKAVKFADEVAKSLVFIETEERTDFNPKPLLPISLKPDIINLKERNIVCTEDNQSPDDDLTVVSNLYFSVNNCPCKKCKSDHLRNTVRIHLLFYILRHHLEFYLRSVYALGYTMDMNVHEELTNLTGLLVTVYSNGSRFQGRVIDGKIDKFLKDVQRSIINKLDTHKFSEYKRQVNDSFSSGDLERDAAYSWNEIMKGSDDFNERHRFQNALRSVSHENFINWLTLFLELNREGNIRRKVSVRIQGNLKPVIQNDGGDSGGGPHDSRGAKHHGGGAFYHSSDDSDGGEDFDDIGDFLEENEHFKKLWEAEIRSRERQELGDVSDLVPLPVLSSGSPVNDMAPDVKCNAVVSGSMKTVSLGQYRGKYVVLFFYSQDEDERVREDLRTFNSYVKELERLNTVILCCTLGPASLLLPTRIDVPGGPEGVLFPMLGDADGDIWLRYGFLEEGPMNMKAHRAICVIDEAGRLRYRKLIGSEERGSVDLTFKILDEIRTQDLQQPEKDEVEEFLGDDWAVKMLAKYAHLRK